MRKTPVRKITVGVYSFSLKGGYEEGEIPIGKEELQALDYLREERIRKKAFRAYERTGRRTLGEEELETLRGEIEKWDKEVRAASPGRGAKAVTISGDGEDFYAELEELVKGTLEKGDPKSPDELVIASAALREDPGLRSLALRRVEAAMKERKRMLDGLEF